MPQRTKMRRIRRIHDTAPTLKRQLVRTVFRLLQEGAASAELAA
jgi:hypothetical protein